MAFTAAPGESFTIRRKVLKLFGSAFHIYDAENRVVGFCKQKAFRLREDIRIFADETCASEVFRLSTQQIIDLSPTFIVTRSADNTVIGQLRRKGLKSIVRDEWLVLDPAGAEIATIREDSGFLALARRAVDLVAVIAPQKFDVRLPDGTVAATFRQHFNPFVYRLGVAYRPEAGARLNPQLVLAAACLLGAIEGRQS
jgi:uncharacterized protein YxjI